VHIASGLIVGELSNLVKRYVAFIWSNKGAVQTSGECCEPETARAEKSLIFVAQVPPLLAEAWAKEVRATIIGDYPELESQFNTAETSSGSSLGKRCAEERDADQDTLERAPKRHHGTD
jgi:hypothetical protein